MPSLRLRAAGKAKTWCLFVLIYGDDDPMLIMLLSTWKAQDIPHLLLQFIINCNPQMLVLTHSCRNFLEISIREKENLCLYGYPSEQWEVNLSAEEVPAELPEAVWA
ncbi:hypothetical protein K1719_023421 [Acacia pycnantha]|nr:hypothetical protein K1719_023421 [Acacia pycnantha]